MGFLLFLLTVALSLHESHSWFSILDNMLQKNPATGHCQLLISDFMSSKDSSRIMEEKFDSSRDYVDNAISRGLSMNGEIEEDPRDPYLHMFVFGHLINFLSKNDLTFTCVVLEYIHPEVAAYIRMESFNKIFIFPDEDVWNMFKFLARNSADLNLPMEIERLILELPKKYDVLKYATNPNDTYVLAWLYEKGAITKTELENLRKRGHSDLNIERILSGRKSPFSEEEQLEIVRNITVASGENKTPLEFAVEGGHINAVKYFVSKGADINIYRDPEGTLLHRAALHGKDEILKYLLDQGMTVDRRNSKGETPLYLAAKHQNHEAVRILKSRGADVDLEDEDGDTLLHLAAKNGDIEAIEGLVAEGANVDASIEGMTPLYRAAQTGNKEVIKVLLSHSADINFGPAPGDKLIHIAAKNNHSLAIQTLLDMGVDVNLEGMYQFAPIHWTARVGFSNVVELLLRNGADIEARIDIGRTPLHEAAFWGQIECSAILLAIGANTNSLDGSGQKPSQLAKQNGHLYLYRMLKDFENKRNIRL